MAGGLLYWLRRISTLGTAILAGKSMLTGVRPGRRSHMIVLLLILTLLAGCSATAKNYDTRPFFQPEQGVEFHGRKTWLDHLVEVDPGKVGLYTVADYQVDPPERIAVLPFVDHGSA